MIFKDTHLIITDIRVTHNPAVGCNQGDTGLDRRPQGMRQLLGWLSLLLFSEQLGQLGLLLQV